MGDSFDQTQNYLFSLQNAGSKFGLERMEAWAEVLGQPQNQIPCIHVAGTNGKGSTCAMLESIFRKAGYKTGMFTSPHLVYLGERVQVDRQPITKEDLLKYVERLKVSACEVEALGYGHPSFFEYMTMLAFLYFQDQQVDVAIIETGLGGRLDASNIISKPLVSVITSIGLDHTHILGDTLALIAKEKAGIIKPGCPVILGVLPGEAKQVIVEVAQFNESPLFSIDELLQFNDYPQTNLYGRYQRINAAVASQVCALLKDRYILSEASIYEGLMAVQWRGRWESMQLVNGNSLILDAAHNEEGIDQLVENLKSLQYSDLTFILGSMHEDRAKVLLEKTAPFAKRLVLVQPKNERAVTVETLQRYVPFDFKGNVEISTIEEIFPCVGVCSVSDSGSATIVAGSLYLLGEVLEALDGCSYELGTKMQDKF